MNNNLKKNDKVKSSPWWKLVPISINSAFGDSLTKSQIDDTCSKLVALKDHEAPYGFSTKSVPNEEIYDRLKEAPKSKNFVLRYSLTNLGEGGYSFKQRVEAIEKLNKICGDITIVTRPLISGRNTDIENLETLVKVARNTGGKLVTGAIHDAYKRKQVDQGIREKLVELCYKHGVKVFHKSSCAAAYITGNDCWVHDVGKPQRYDVLDDLGYDYEIIDGKICLEQASVGDLNFLRMITRSDVLTKRLLSGYNLLYFSTDECKFDVTSSWYSWSRNAPCEINCDYCIIRKIEYLDKRCLIGVEPSKIMEQFEKAKEKTDFKNFNGGQYLRNDNSTELIGYNQIRTVQKCCTHNYK